MTTSGVAMFPQPFDVIAIGASLGGILALRHILARLPENFSTPIVVVQHRSSRMDDKNSLPRCLRESRLPVCEPNHGDLMQRGVVYVAPSNAHLVLTPGGIFNTDHGEKLLFCRPSVNKLFYSVAQNYRERAIGVILTGSGTDGALGVVSLKMSGSRVIAQSPETCQSPHMPTAAINTGCVDLVLSLDGIADALVTLTMVPGALDVFPAKRFVVS